MALCEIYAISNRDHLRMRAFRAQGIELLHSWRSWSGVRPNDGVVVFAIAQADVVVDDGGCRCLLWSRATVEARLGRQCSDERLAHCRLAVIQESAEGILLRADARVACHQAVALRVRKMADEYWALWGSAGQVEYTPRFSRKAGGGLRYAS